MLDDFPRSHRARATDGESSPLLADLDGDNQNELCRHLRRLRARVPAQRHELPGWPVRGDKLPASTPAAARSRPARSSQTSAAPCSPRPRSATLDRDGIPEIVAADFEGKVYGWSAEGAAGLHARRPNLDFSGKPLAAVRERAKRRAPEPHPARLPRLAGPRRPRRRPQASRSWPPTMDRHLYAWNRERLRRAAATRCWWWTRARSRPTGSTPTPTPSPSTRRARATPSSRARSSTRPRSATSTATTTPRRAPEIVDRHQRGVHGRQGTTADFNAGRSTRAPSPRSSRPATARLRRGDANGRVYALHADGDEPRGPAALVAGWPVKIGLADVRAAPGGRRGDQRLAGHRPAHLPVGRRRAPRWA